MGFGYFCGAADVDAGFIGCDGCSKDKDIG
jgi:hypothetical protein